MHRHTPQRPEGAERAASIEIPTRPYRLINSVNALTACDLYQFRETPPAVALPAALSDLVCRRRFGSADFVQDREPHRGESVFRAIDNPPP